jgi:two-component system osmolarity sensor histidine kinase EnvZ
VSLPSHPPAPRSPFKRLLPRTLFARSLMILVIPILLIQVIATYTFFDRHWNSMTGRLAFAVAGEISMIVDSVEADPGAENVAAVAGEVYRYFHLVINFEPGKKLYPGIAAENAGARRHSEITQMLRLALDDRVKRPYHLNVDRKEKWVEVTLQIRNGLLRISVPQGRLYSSSGYIFLLWMIGTSLLLMAIAVLFMRNQIRPIRRLAVAAERIGRGLDIPASFKPEGASEIRQAAAAFIEMHERIRRQIQQRAAMLAGVSHDLRTPLTRMKLQAAMLENSPDTEALKSDIQDMERMIGAYLDFVRGGGGEQVERQDLGAILERIAAGVKREGRRVELSLAGDLGKQMRPVAMERALSNIVGNARKFAPQIWIAARRADAETIEIVIEDNGPGIPDDKLEDVFRPFYRVEGSRNATTGGVGLGLPIAQDIVHGHGGSITLGRSEMGGLRATILLPV